MFVEKRYDLGLRILLALAKEPERYHAARDLAEREKALEFQVRRVLSALTRAGFLSSTIGREGGYRLAKPPEEINLYEVFRALSGEGPVVGLLGQGRGEPTSPGPSSPTFGFWRTLEEKFRQILQAQSLADLLS
ncbi:MAG: RrF2 family transcriptional regulator [Candidatus Bipolaricaulaceae bacterium]